MNRSRLYSLLLWALCPLFAGYAQDTLVLVHKQPFATLASWGRARPGQVLIADDNANLYLFDSRGKQLNEQSLTLRLSLSAVHSRGGVQTLLFSVNTQQLFFVDRFLRLTRQLQVPFTFGNIAAVAWAPDATLRLWDSRARRLLAWDMVATEPQELYRLQEELPAVKQMQFVQNYLLLTDEKTYILFFDFLGNYIDKIYFRKSIESIGFWQEGYWLREGNRLRGVRLPDHLTAFEVIFPVHANEEKNGLLKILCLYPSFLSWNGISLHFWQLKE